MTTAVEVEMKGGGAGATGGSVEMYLDMYLE